MRICSNPDCAKLWDDDNVNPCLKCGWSTVPYSEIKATPEKSKKEKNVSGYRD
ncbi:MAG: hypothetical protein WC455_14065 [Dehalococcoidia bacterium]|jgi:Zn ribbon nucleic-acid-binding protein